MITGNKTQPSTSRPRESLANPSKLHSPSGKALIQISLSLESCRNFQEGSDCSKAGQKKLLVENVQMLNPEYSFRVAHQAKLYFPCKGWKV